MAWALRKLILGVVLIAASTLVAGTTMAQVEVPRGAEGLSAPAGTATATYDGDTGEVHLAVSVDANLISMFISNGVFINNEQTFSPPNFGGSAPPQGVFNLGPILPAGACSADEFHEMFGDSGVLVQPAGGTGVTTPFQVLPCTVPEPTTWALLILVGLGLATRRPCRS